MIYNCRCTMVAAVDGVDAAAATRRARDPVTGKDELISDMTFSKWQRWKETTRQKTGAQGQEIIDKPTYNNLTRDFLRRGGALVRGEEAETHLILISN